MSNEYVSDPNLRKVSLGIDVAHFITHDPVGIYLIEKAGEMRESARAALVDVAPNDVKEITRLQWNARVPDMVIEWLNLALDDAKAAEELIIAQESESGY